jgi:hypothetical protein
MIFDAKMFSLFQGTIPVPCIICRVLLIIKENSDFACPTSEFVSAIDESKDNVKAS